nr:hypothetical protein [Tanacetum cinerariifolium]
MDRDNQEALHETLTTSRKRRPNDQFPPPPPLKDSDRSKKKKQDSDASASQQPQAQTPDWLKPIPEKEPPKTPEPDWVIPSHDLPGTENNQIGKSKLSKADLENKIDLTNPEGNGIVPNVSKLLPPGSPPERRNALSICKLKAAYYQDFGLEELVPSLWIKSERNYDICAAYKISHWWFKRKEFYITRRSALYDLHAIKSHMKILSVVSLKTFSRYGYTYLKEIVLRRVDYQGYKISEADFKNLHPNDFEDMYMLHLQGKLNQLSGSDKVSLFNVVNLDRNNQKNIMMETEVHKFSDGTLIRILEKLDHMVKDFRLFKYNPGMENKIWSKDDKRRSKEFMEVIEGRLK